MVSSFQKIHPFKISYKDESRWWQRIENIFPSTINAVTITSNTIYFPSKEWEESSSIVFLATLYGRSVVKMTQQKSLGWMYWLLYSLPQSLFLIPLVLMFILPIWMCLLLMMTCWLPIPSPRSYFENTGKIMSLLIFNLFLHSWNKSDGECLERLDKAAESYNVAFKTKEYWWMNVFQKKISAKFIMNYDFLNQADIYARVIDELKCLL